MARPAHEPDIAEQVVVARKLALDSTTAIRRRVGACLWKLKGRGLGEEVAQVGDYTR